MLGPLAGAKAVLGLMLALAASLPSLAHGADPGFLGLEVQGLDERAATALGPNYAKGVIVKDVAVGEPGALAGFRRGDFIVEFNGAKIGTFDDLLKQIARTKADDKIAVVVLRSGKTTELTLRVTARPQAWSVATPIFNAYPELGMTVVTITDEVRQKFALPWGSIGVVVSEVDPAGPVANGLKVGDVIVSINLRDVWEPRHLTRHLEDARKEGRSNLFLLIRASSGYRYALLPVK